MKPSCTRHGGQPTGVMGESAVRPSFIPELTSTQPKSNAERLAEYQLRKERSMKHQGNEITRLLATIKCINENFAAKAEDWVNWKQRYWVVYVEQGGKAVYAASLKMDSPAFEAEVRLVREELEQMTVAALSGLEVAA